MPKKTFLAALAVGLLMTGCVPSLHPLYSEKDLAFDPSLEGTWVEAEGRDTWAFKKSEAKAYELIYTEYPRLQDSSPESPKGIASKFEAHLVRLGDFLLLDLYPEAPDIGNDFYKGHLIPAHTFARIWKDGEVIRVGMLDPDWFKRMVTEEKLDIACERVDEDFILTASTEALQQFLLAHAEDAKAFGKPSEMHRKK